MLTRNSSDVIVVGAGVVGAAWADYAPQAGLTLTRVIEDVRGQIATCTQARRTEAWQTVLYTLTSPEVYLLLVKACGWRPGRYESWLDRTLSSLLLDRSDDRDARHAGGTA